MVLRQRLYDVLICLGLTAAILSLVVFPSESVSAAKAGIDLCLKIIVPSLFPFFVISSLIINLGLADRAGRILAPVMRPLFGVGGAASSALVLGFLGGYPVGARTAAALYSDGTITKTEAERLLSFCNNSGPAFILGVVGAGVFGSSRAGLFLYSVHILVSVAIGFMFRQWGEYKPYDKHVCHKPHKREPFASAFVESVKSSFMSSIGICGFVIFFTVVVRLLYCAGVIPFISNTIYSVLSPLGIDKAWGERLFTGIIELSSGVWSLKEAGSLPGSIVMASFMLGWAGISIHCQTLSILSESGLKSNTYVIGKLLHGIISALLTYILSQIFLFESPAAFFFSELPESARPIRPGIIFAVSIISAAVIFAFFVLSTKNTGKRKPKNI